MCFNEPGAYGCLDRTSRAVYRPEGATEDEEDGEEEGDDSLEERPRPGQRAGSYGGVRDCVITSI